MSPDPAAFSPLSPPALHILLVLAGEPLHGYGIMQAVLHDSGGRYKLGPGTLYDNLQRLLDHGLVGEAKCPRGEDPRRHYYRLSDLGRKVLSLEISRLAVAVRNGKRRLGLVGETS